MDWILEHVRAEWDTIVRAPFLLFLLFIFGVLVGWLGSRTLYEQDLQTLRDQNGYLQSKVNPIEPPMPSAVASPTTSQMATTTPSPINSAEWEALQKDNAKLKTENARLRKARPSHVVAGLPSPRASTTPSKIGVGDCDALAEIHALLDSATRQRGNADADLVARLKNPAQLQIAFEMFLSSLNAAQTIENQAVSSFTSLQGRFCDTHAPAGH